MNNAPRAALLHAILYELQPIRFSSIDFSPIFSLLHSLWSGSVPFVTETVQSLLRGSCGIVREMTGRHWLGVGAVVAYYYLVRFVHRILDAGPILVILTALVTIFTIGLGDTATQDGISAYSVFNRGFERILGSVDVEALVQQHVGVAMGMAGMGMAMPHPAPPIDEPPPRRRHEEDGNDRPENAARALADDEDNGAVPERGVSRKSGKRARRRNLDQRRELQQQRQAAIMAMGFAGDEQGQEEMVAMQRLLEEEIAANNRPRD
jgi:hypothetical protein